GGAALEDRDIEGIDLDLHDLLGASGCRGAGPDGIEEDRTGLADEALERPVAALLDTRRHAGERRDRAELPAAAGELEGGHVVLGAVVVAGERRRPQEVDRAVRPDQSPAGEGGSRREKDRKGRRRDTQGDPRPASGSAVPTESRMPHRMALRGCRPMRPAWLRPMTSGHAMRFPGERQLAARSIRTSSIPT